MSILKPDSLLTLPEAEAEAVMNELSLAGQASVVLMTPWERRQEIILLSQDSRALVQGLPVQELFWTVKAIGPQDAVHILNLANAEQLQFVFDLDWWHKAELRPEKIATWILLLFETGEEAMASWLRWLMKKDETLLPAILRPFIRIYKKPDDMDIQEAKDKFPQFTLDNVYFIFFKKETLQPIWGRFLMKMLEVSPGLYRDVLETILGETEAKNMEKSLRLRHSRIGDWGLPDYYEALDIYAPLPGNYIKKVEIAYFEGGNGSDILLPAFVPTLYMGDYPVLRIAIEELSGTRVMERIIQEWVGAANKVLMVDDVDLDDPDALRNSLFKVAAFLNLGLEAAAKTEHRSSKDILKSGVIEDILRLANTMTRRLAAKARSLVDSGRISKDFSYLPEAWADVLKGLLFRRPLLWDPVLSKYRPFCDTAELAATERLITIADEWTRLMSCIIPQHGNWALEIPWSSTNLGHLNELIFPQALLTALAQKTLGGELKFYPVPAGKLNYLRSTWFPDPSFSEEKNSSGPGPLLETVKHCVEALQPIVEQADFTRERLNSIVKESLMTLYEEWMGLPADIPIDGRFVSSLIIDLEAD
ncbi:MAG: hypothetical protein DRP37_07120 [Thermodesulfobacteriota bacterium]|nr:MAG: hypothetical protein DRP37_07120 [Thermodesulfobacteriota bacterium]